MAIKNNLLKKLKNKDGMTIVNVLVAFAVLMFVLLMFWQTVHLATNIFNKANLLRANTENLYSNFYRTNTYVNKNGEDTLSAGGSTAQSFTFSDNKGGSFVLESFQGEYKSGEYSVSYFGKRKIGG